MELEITTIPNTTVSENYHSIKCPVLDASDSYTYDDFFTNYMLPNMPCIIKNVATNWQSTTLWIKDEKPNFEYLNGKYKNSVVTIYDCRTKHFNSQKTQIFKFDRYIEYWENYIAQNYSSDLPLYYLKDWHLQQDFPKDKFYEIPIYFASDWLNEYLTSTNGDDYRFVYMGPKKSWTPFHVDVFTSYSWSVNVCGKKKWLLFPPGAENHLKDKLNNLPFDLGENYNKKNCIEVLQDKKEAIFVPSGWHHQVWNLEDTISINHNWINGCNISKMWHSLETHLKDVKREIDDCKDMEDFPQQCQMVLKSSYGFDFFDFYDFIKYIAETRLNHLNKKVPLKLPQGKLLGRNHAIFDLKAVLAVLTLFLQCNEVTCLKEFIDIKPAKLLNTIESYINTT